MTLDDYMNAELFPVTTQASYTADIQLRMDAFNLDALKEEIELKQPLNDRQRAALQELTTKEPHMARLTQELSAAGT